MPEADAQRCASAIRRRRAVSQHPRSFEQLRELDWSKLVATKLWVRSRRPVAQVIVSQAAHDRIAAGLLGLERLDLGSVGASASAVAIPAIQPAR